MLYDALIRRQSCPKYEERPLHYFDSAELLHRLQAEGYTRADMARMTSLTVPQVLDRLRLLNLDEGLRTYLRQENAPESIALLLLMLPDPLIRRRMARRIVAEHLCIRDARLLVRSAMRHAVCDEPVRSHVVAVIRDIRLYRNAIRDIAEQMKSAGVRASFTERRAGGMQELTVAYPARRRRTERYHSM